MLLRGGRGRKGEVQFEDRLQNGNKKTPIRMHARGMGKVISEIIKLNCTSFLPLGFNVRKGEQHLRPRTLSSRYLGECDSDFLVLRPRVSLKKSRIFENNRHLECVPSIRHYSASIPEILYVNQVLLATPVGRHPKLDPMIQPRSALET